MKVLFPTIVVAGIVLCGSGKSLAQTADPKMEIFGSVGWAELFRFDDSTPFGNSVAVGGGIGFRLLNRLGLEVEFHGMGGLEESVRTSMVASVNGSYYFSTRNATVQPYLLGGLGMLRTKNRVSTYLSRGSETEFVDTGWGLNLGAGVRIPLSPKVSLRPEVRYINGVSKSRVNLGEVRASMAAGYHW